MARGRFDDRATLRKRRSCDPFVGAVQMERRRGRLAESDDRTRRRRANGTTSASASQAGERPLEDPPTARQLQPPSRSLVRRDTRGGSLPPAPPAPPEVPAPLA